MKTSTKRLMQKIAYGLSMAMIVTMMPISSIKAQELDTHAEDCPYVESIEGHECTFVHEHDETCGYVEGVEEIPCDMECTDIDDDGEIDHVDGCAYTPAVLEQPCTFVHEHDGACGYVEAVEGVKCTCGAITYNEQDDEIVTEIKKETQEHIVEQADSKVIKEWTEEDFVAFGNGTLSLCDQVAFVDSMSNVSVMSAMRVANVLSAEPTAIPATTIGGESNPFKIGNATILQELAMLVNNGTTYGNDYSYADAHYEMVSDIDMDDIGWTTISNFMGSFNGNRHTISSSVIKTAIGENGLFASGTESVIDVMISYTGVTTPSESWSDYTEEPYKPINQYGPLTGYYIATAEQLAWVANSVNNGEISYNGYTYVLSENIDLSAHEWVPIGTEENPFEGAFYGADNGAEKHTISGLYVESTENFQGLFGYVSNTGGTEEYESKTGIYNVNVEGSVTGGDYTGGIVGYNDAEPEKYGYIDNCTFSGRVQGKDCTGGIVGQNFSSDGTVTVQNCSNTSIVVGGNNVGGVVGFNGTVANDTAIVDSCSNSGNVSGGNCVGGVVGISSPGLTGATKVMNCSATCTMVTGASDVGRVVGYNEVTDEDRTATLSNNQAYDQMEIGASGSEAVPNENIGGDQINGANMDDGSFTPTDNLWTSYATEFASKEDGSSEANAIVITTAEELAYLAKMVNDGNSYDGLYFKLGNNIDLSAHEWVPIGTEVADVKQAFLGNFNGDGNAISGMTIETNCEINEAHYYVGLFGCVKDATLENLNVSGTINVTSNTYASAYVGGLSGCVEGSGRIKKCGTNVTITVSETSNIIFYGVGGLVGESRSGISNCYATGNISVEESDQIKAGGLVGFGYEKISNCYATGNVLVNTSSSNNSVGGLVGDSGSEISNCYATGNVSNSGNKNIYTGGIVGYIYMSKIANCVSLSNTIASISANGGDAASGCVVAHDGNANKPSDMSGLYAWSGTTGGGNDKTTSGLDGADLYYSSSKGFVLEDGSDFEWSTICPSEGSWTIPTGDDAKYQLPYLTSVSKEIPQNPLANLEFVTVTFDYAEDSKVETDVKIECGSSLGSSNIPEGIWGTVDETTGAITGMDGDIVFYKDTTITELVPEASVTVGNTTTQYDTLENAIVAANTSGGTVTLLKEVEIDTTLTISGTVTLNLGGYAFTYTGEDNVMTINGTLTIEDDTEIAGTIIGNVEVGTDGTLTMTGGAIEGTVDMQGAMKVSGNPKITTVSLAAGKTITVTSVLTEGASIGISTISEATDGNPVDMVTGDNLNSSYFTLDSSETGTLKLTTDKTKIQLVAPHTHTWSYSQGTKEDPENPEGTIDDDSKIVATCNTGACSGNPTQVELSMSATDIAYTGYTYEYVMVIDEDDIQGDAIIQYRGVGSTSYAESETAPTNVGSYEAFITLGNVTAKAFFEITPVPMPGYISATDYIDLYDGQSHGITVSGYPDGAKVQYGTTADTCNQDSLTYSNVTTGTTVYYKVSMDNYTDVTGSARVIITKAPLTVKVKDGQSITKTYDGTVTVSDDVLLEVEGLQNGETATASGTCTYVSTDVSDNITIDIKDISINYTGDNPANKDNYSYETVNLTTTGVITQKDVSEAGKTQAISVIEGDISFIEPTFKDGDEKDVTGSVIKYTYNSVDYETYSALINALNDVTITESGDTITVGYEYKTNGNYTGTISGDITMAVQKVAFSGDMTVNSANYGDTWEDILEFSQEIYAGTVLGETIPGTYTLKIDSNDCNSTDKPKVAEYNWTVTFTSTNKKHENLEVESGTVTVNPLTVTYTWDKTSFEYDGTEKLPIPTITNKVGNDDVNVTATGAQIDVGNTYATTVSLEGADARNYALPTANANITFEITPATMPDTITVTDYNGTYDGQSHGITVSGYLDGAKVQYGTTADTCNQDSLTYKNVTTGTTVYYKVSMDNYTDVTGSARVIITKAPLTVKVKDGQSITKTYDGTVAVSDDVLLEVEGLQNGETATASGTCTYVSTNVADEITINITNISIDYTGENAANVDNYSYTATNLTTTGAITRENSTGSVGDDTTYTRDGDTITYGDTVTIQYTPQMAVTNSLLMMRSLGLNTNAASKAVELWYGNKKITLDNTLDNIEEGDTANIVFAVDKDNFPDASEFDGSTNRTFTIKWGGDGNLNPSTTTLNLKLGQKIIDDVTVDETNGGYTSAYTGLVQDFEDVALTSSDIVSGDTVGLTVDYTTTQAHVTEYNVSGTVVKSVTDSDAGYYVLANNITFSGTVAITQKDMSETDKAQSATITEGNVSFIAPTFAGVNSEDATGSIKYTYNSTEYNSYDELITALDDVIVTNSGDTITVRYEFTANGNYTGTISGDITMKVLKVVFDGNMTINDATYGDAWEDILEFTQETYTATIDGEEVAGIYTLKIEENTYSGTEIPDAGDYDLAVTFTSSNGTYENLSVESDTVTVNPLTATYTWDQTTFEYDGTEKLPIPTITNKVGDDDVKVTATGAQIDADNAYTATAVLEGADASNYALPTTNADITFDITPIKATGTISMTVADNGDTPLKAQDTITIEYKDTLGETPTYQWYDENDTAIAEATNASYTIPAGTTSGSYYCVVTLDGNTEGSFTSEKIQIDATKPIFEEITASSGNGTATLKWSFEDGVSPITGYQVKVFETVTITGGDGEITTNKQEIDGSPFTIVPGATSYTVTGLTNGTKYTFELTASNAIGNGVSEELTTTPSKPTSTGGSASNQGGATSNPVVTLPTIKEEMITPEEVPGILEQVEESVTKIEKNHDTDPMTTEPDHQDEEETTGEDMYIYQQFDNTLGTVVGEDIHKNARIIITLLEQEEELSVEHKNAVDTFEKMCEVLKNYEVSIVDGDFIGEINITFQVGEEYNGETVTIIHLTEEGYESFVRIVKDGKVDVTVSSLSPFIILHGEVDVAQLFQTPADEDQPVELQEVTDSSVNIIPIICILLVILSGIFFILYKKRKEEKEE